MADIINIIILYTIPKARRFGGNASSKIMLTNIGVKNKISPKYNFFLLLAADIGMEIDKVAAMNFAPSVGTAVQKIGEVGVASVEKINSNTMLQNTIRADTNIDCSKVGGWLCIFLLIYMRIAAEI